MDTNRLSNEAALLLQAYRHGATMTSAEVLAVLVSAQSDEDNQELQVTEDEIANLRPLLVGSRLNMDERSWIGEHSAIYMLQDSGDVIPWAVGSESIAAVSVE